MVSHSYAIPSNHYPKKMITIMHFIELPDYLGLNMDTAKEAGQIPKFTSQMDTMFDISELLKTTARIKTADSIIKYALMLTKEQN